MATTGESDTSTLDAADATGAASRRRPADDRWPDLFAVAMLAAATVATVATAVPPWRRFFDRSDDVLSLLTVSIVPSLVYAALLFVTAIALRRRLRVAFWIATAWWLVIPQVSRLQAIATGRHPTVAAVGFVLVGVALVLAWRARGQFAARGVAGSLWSAGAVLVGGWLAVLLGGAALVSRFGSSPSFADSLGDVASTLLTEVGRAAGATDVQAPLWARGVVGLGGTIVVLAAAHLLFRSPKETRTLTVPDEARVRDLLATFGDHDSLGYFATRRDKSVVWDTGDPATARAGVSYRTIGSVSLASGNPVGDPERWAAAIGAWRRRARAHGWSLAVMGAGADGAAAYAAAGLTAYEIGDEAIVDLTAFSLTGAGMRPVRRSVERLTRRGYTVRVRRHAALTPEDLDALGRAAAEWRGDGGDERGFSMALGRLADPLDGACVLVEARDPDGRLRAFLSLVPWGRHALSLDLMRRDPAADNGLVELMVAGLAADAARLGVGVASLNFAMFREAFERGAELGAGPLARAWRQSLLLASRTWQLESLYRSNAKYLPRWEPRFLCFEYASDLPRIGSAAGSAEGFLTRPTIALLRRKALAGPVAPGLGCAGDDHADAVRALMAPPREALADALDAALATTHLPEQVRVRHAKLDRLRAAGVEPYPATFARTATLAELRADAAGLGPDESTGRCAGVVGRVMLKRDHGGLSFATLRDGTGDLQVMVDAARVGPEAAAFWAHQVDLGDHVGVTGELVTTRTGEPTVRAEAVQLTSKALRPLPDKHRGLTNPEARVRARHVDLIVRPDARTVAYQRAAVVRALRDTLHDRGFTEVETPILQTVHGGANARPFETHINAYDLDLSLRIATELHLKRLVVGGLDKVFEIGRQFRNEGADLTHNPEFTSLEVYETYSDYTAMRTLTQQLVQAAATAVHGSPVARRRDADRRTVEHDLSGDWPVVPLLDAVSTALGEEVTLDTPLWTLVRYAEKARLDVDADRGWGHVLEAVHSALCEKRTVTPVFYTDFPVENAPLTRPHRTEPRLAEKWDLVLFGSEQGTAYSELVDPVDQRRRLVEQSLLAAAGDPEAMRVDEDFLAALEQGMPPTGGMGLGVDRLVMNLTGLGIRDTILFPLVKPR